MTATPAETHSAFYRFVAVADTAACAAAVRQLAQEAGLNGSIVVASEGISGAVAGASAAVAGFEAALQGPTVLDGALHGMPFKRSACAAVAAFARLKVSVKPETVALGLPPPHHTPAGTAASPAPVQLTPQAWREQVLQPYSRAVLLDNRNHFEFRLGRFQGAQDPQVHNFRDFVAYVQQHAPAWRAAGRPVAMYCTGGIRCEKTAPWLQSLGLQVWQLEGGVLTYFAQVPDAQQDWQGSCFVFDNRLALNTRLQPAALRAEDIYDPAFADEAWRLQRAQRLHDSGNGGAPQPQDEGAIAAPALPGRAAG